MLRLRVGDHVLLLDNSGREHEVELTALTPTAAQGVAGFVPVVSGRSLIRSSQPSSARLERWRRVVVEAAEQSGRCRLPEISPPVLFDEACASAAGLPILRAETAAIVAAALVLHELGELKR